MQEVRIARQTITSAQIFLIAFLVSCALCAAVIGSFPLQMSIATIFLFAGVHNFMEFRYFAARMPVRWGRSRNFYAVGIAGVVALSAAYLTLYFSYGNWLWSINDWTLSLPAAEIRYLFSGSEFCFICEEDKRLRVIGVGHFQCVPACRHLPG
jgi:hypothetical protein